VEVLESDPKLRAFLVKAINQPIQSGETSMIHLAIIGTLGTAAAGVSALFPPAGLALGALAVGLGLIARERG
jgi:hypothetical protein